MISIISSTDYITLTKFCQYYKYAFVALTAQADITDSNEIAGRLFNTTTQNLQSKNLITLCHMLDVDCPISSLMPDITLNNTYHPAMATQCHWHAIAVKDSDSSCQWVLMGKLQHLTNAHYHTRLDQCFINQLPIYIYCKNSDSVYIYANQAANDFAGHSLVGKTDHELPWHENADFLIESDRIALAEKPLLSMQTIHNHHAEQIQVCTIKYPLYDHDHQVIGISCVSTLCDKITAPCNSITLLQDSHRNISLAPQERIYIDWLIKGKTAEEISLILNIPKRTVESHLARIRKKAHCQSQFQLGLWVAQHLSINT